MQSNQTSINLIRRHGADFIALFLAILGFLASALVTRQVFEGVPHIEDEIAYVWQAKVLVYLAYWIGAILFGPRYYYEGIYSLTLISAAGIAWLAGWPTSQASPFIRRSG